MAETGGGGAGDRAAARLVRDVYARLEAALESDLAPMGMTPAQYGVMRRIQEVPGSSSAQLARRVQVTAQTMHTLVGVLEHRGWVRRSPHPELGRVRQVHLTEPGAALLDKANGHAYALAHQMITGFTAAEANLLAQLLQRAEHNLRIPDGEPAADQFASAQ